MSNQIEIIAVKKKGKNYIVSLSDNRDMLICSLLAERFSLKPGIELSVAAFDLLKEQSDIIRGREYLHYLLARRSYSVGNIMVKLKEKGYEKKPCEKLIDEFIEKGYLDDHSFAVEMTESILRTKPAGRAFIINALRRKYVSSELARAVVDQIFIEIDDVDLASRLLEQRKRYFSKFDLETARNKAYNYLSRRAIGYGAAKDAFNRIFAEDE